MKIPATFTMKPYARIYLIFFGLTQADFIPCEACGARAVDFHHIDARGMGGSKEKDYIQNVAALCRMCHNQAHQEPDFNSFVLERHLKKVLSHKDKGLENLKKHNLIRFFVN